MPPDTHLLTAADLSRSNISNHRGPDILSCLLIVIRVLATVMFLLPVAGQWYRYKAE